MAEITAAAVRTLRDRTGLPMMDCKKALQDAGGDADKAVALLRKAGAKMMEKRAGRSTTSGRIAVFISPDAAVGTMIAGALTTTLSVSVSQRCYRIEYERAKLLLIYAYFFCGLAATCLLQAAELAYAVRLAVKIAILAGYCWIGAVYGWWAVLLQHARRGG